MYAYVSEASNVIQEYKKLPSSGPRELTPAMIRSIEEADKPAKRGKKPETQSPFSSTRGSLNQPREIKGVRSPKFKHLGSESQKKQPQLNLSRRKSRNQLDD